jgi:hypothetical protein
VKKVQLSKQEWNALEAQEAFNWAEQPPGKEVNPLTLIFTMKVNQEGQVEEYQCRLCGGKLKKSSKLEQGFSEEKDQATAKKSRTTERMEDFTTKPLSKDPFIRMRTAVLGM